MCERLSATLGCRAFDVHELVLRSPQTSSPSSLTPLQPSELAPLHYLTNTRVLRAAWSLSPTSTAVPDLVYSRLLRLLVTTSVSVQAVNTRQTALTNIAYWPVIWRLPLTILLLSTAVSLVPVQAGLGKLQSITIGQALCCLFLCRTQLSFLPRGRWLMVLAPVQNLYSMAVEFSSIAKNIIMTKSAFLSVPRTH